MISYRGDFLSGGEKMEFLKFLESIRTPFFDGFFSLITRFGEETLFIIIGILFLWCINKKQGYYLFFVGFSGLLINQFLKFTFRVPRPWVKDPSLTIVESAKEMAYGYSFPSGHTQVSVGLYGGMARLFKNKILRGVLIILVILIPFSRMYLGVHTPMDVITSVVIALLLVFAFYPIINNDFENVKKINILFAICFAASALYLVYILVGVSSLNVDAEELNKGIADAYKISGCLIGLWLSYNIDMKYLCYKTDAPVYAQIIKFATGLIILLLIKEGLKEPLLKLFNGNQVAGAIRYFVIVFFSATLWPMTFKLYKKISH